MGRHGADLIRDGQTVLTHCNAGALATAGYGTALGVIRAAVEQGKKIHVFADETRPFLQGAQAHGLGAAKGQDPGDCHHRQHGRVFHATGKDRSALSSVPTGLPRTEMWPTRLALILWPCWQRKTTFPFTSRLRIQKPFGRSCIRLSSL